MSFWPFRHEPSFRCALPSDIQQQAAYWLPVCPVHFIPDRDTLVLTHPLSLGLSQAEAIALVERFNQHFSDDQYCLVVVNAHCWALGSATPWRLSLPSLDDAVAMNLKDAFQHGKDARAWRKLLNEAQMLWFGDDVNVRREQEGKPAVNGLWVMSRRRWWQWWIS